MTVHQRASRHPPTNHWPAPSSVTHPTRPVVPEARPPPRPEGRGSFLTSVDLLFICSQVKQQEAAQELITKEIADAEQVKKQLVGAGGGAW